MKRLVLILIFLIWTAVPVMAQGTDITVTCPANGPECSMAPNPGDPLFYETNMLPGDTVSRKLTVINQDETQACNLEVKTYNDRRTPDESDFPKKLFSTINKDGSLLLNNTIQEVYDLGQIDLTSVPAGGSVVYDWTVTFDAQADNYYQLNETIFDFDVVFFCGDQPRAELLLTKTNNRLGQDNSPGDPVIYTLKVTAVTDVDNVRVTDLPPRGFTYRAGSWTAQTDRRGNLKPDITGEPTYHSPGDWNLGDMVAGEVVTLTYVADIGGDQKAGVYPDLAWANGQDGDGNEVRANLDSGYFVGTQVKVVKPVVASAEYSVRQTGQVLGASTILPATGGEIFWLWLGFLSIVLGGVIRKKIIVGVFVASLLLMGQPTKVMAANLSIRLTQPASPTNQKALDLSFVVLDLTNNPVEVTCYKKGPEEADFSAFGGEVSVISGGTSEQCPATESIIGGNGSYQFKAVTSNGSAFATSNIVSVEFLTDSPDIPQGYTKERMGTCQYKLTFTTADDGKTNRVEIYRSTQETFTVSSSNRIATINTGPNQKQEYVDSLPDCSVSYFYALRAFSDAGNDSALTGDSIVVANDQTVMTATQPDNLPRRLSPQETPQVNPPPSETPGLVLGDQSTEPVATDEQILVEQKSILQFAIPALIILFSYLLYRRFGRR